MYVRGTNGADPPGAGAGAEMKGYGVRAMLIEVCFMQNKEEMIHALTRFSRDREGARDAVQEGFIKALQNKAMLEAIPESAMKAWLYTAAKNALIDAKRRNARLLFTGEGEREAPVEAANPLDRILVGELMQALPPELQKVVAMRYFAGFNATEIGQALGLPAATVRTRLKRAMALMRKRMAQPSRQMDEWRN